MNPLFIQAVCWIYIIVTMFWGIHVWTCYYGSTSKKWCLVLFWPIYLLIWLCISVPKMIILFAIDEIKK